MIRRDNPFLPLLEPNCIARHDELANARERERGRARGTGDWLVDGHRMRSAPKRAGNAKREGAA